MNEETRTDEEKVAEMNGKIQNLSSFGHFLARYAKLDNGSPINSPCPSLNKVGNIIRNKAGEIQMEHSTYPVLQDQLIQVNALATLLVRYPGEIVAVAVKATLAGLKIAACTRGGVTE